MTITDEQLNKWEQSTKYHLAYINDTPELPGDEITRLVPSLIAEVRELKQALQTENERAKTLRNNWYKRGATIAELRQTLGDIASSCGGCIARKALEEAK